jgi:His-Xaa-Ser system protein HxsD
MANTSSKKQGSAILRLSQKLYPLDVIYSAAYVMLDKAYILLDEQNGRIIVSITPKGSFAENKGAKNVADSINETEMLAAEFSSQLINYAFSMKMLEKNAAAKQAILHEIFSQFAGIAPAVAGKEDGKKSGNPDDSEDFLDDPEGILIPWEEKHGKKKAKRRAKKR